MSGPGPARPLGVQLGQSGVIDLRQYQELLARVEKLEKQLGGKRITGGTFLLEWTVKGINTATRAVPTGLAVIQGLGGQLIGGSAGFVLGGVGFVGGTVTWEARSLIGEIAPGTTIAAAWIAIGE